MAALHRRMRQRFGDRLRGLILFGSRARGDRDQRAARRHRLVNDTAAALLAKARNLNKALEIGNEGDFDLEPSDRDDVVATAANAAAFVDAVAALIERRES
jgi:hypothetical protein